MTQMNGRVVHFEIPFDDADRAGRFYAEVFGWSANDVAEIGYTRVTTGPTTPDEGPSEPGFVNGGLLPRQEGFSAPVVTIEVEDIEAALAAVQEHGGSVVEGRSDVGEIGFAAYFRDSEGNLTGLWQSGHR
ncbi:MAG: VOC family protein [Nocardioidaceae bacterium]